MHQELRPVWPVVAENRGPAAGWTAAAARPAVAAVARVTGISIHLRRTPARTRGDGVTPATAPRKKYDEMPVSLSSVSAVAQLQCHTCCATDRLPPCFFLSPLFPEGTERTGLFLKTDIVFQEQTCDSERDMFPAASDSHSWEMDLKNAVWAAARHAARLCDGKPYTARIRGLRPLASAPPARRG